MAHHVLPATAETVHGAYFSRALKSVRTLDLETLTHHACDDHPKFAAVLLAFAVEVAASC